MDTDTMSGLEQRDFLDALWPAAGLRCIAYLATGGMRHLWGESTGEVCDKLTPARQAGNDVYFAPAVFSDEKRRQAQVAALKCQWADLDAGEGKPYATQAEAIEALQGWCARHGVPLPTITVDSGHGWHVYWVYAQSAAPDRWLRVATKLKQAAAATGLHLDPSRTADSASLLRLPGTINHKDPEDPRPVRVAGGRDGLVDIDVFEASLPAPAGLLPEPPVAPRGKPAKGVSEFTSGIGDDFPPADAEAIATRCAQMRHIRDIGGRVPEPLWRAGLSVLTRCVDGETLIHEWSKGDPRYNADETRQKAALTQGPATCAHFASLSTRCTGCPMLGKVSSPILLGTALPEPEVREDDIAPDQRLNEFGPWRVTARGVRFAGTGEDGENVMVPVTLCPLWVVEARERAREGDEPDHSALMLQWHGADGRSRSGLIAQADVYDQRGFTRWLGDYNLIAQVANLKLLTQFVQAYTFELIKRRRVQTYHDRLGWWQGAILAAGQKVTAEGAEPVRVQSTTPVAQARVAEHASAAMWAETTELLWTEGGAAHAFPVLAAFGSPLLELVGWQSAIVSLTGPTGTGKTTAMEAALSIYGQPEAAMLAPTATPNAVGELMPALRHLPVGVDEISRWPVQRIANFIYEATNGEGKATLNRNREMRRMQTWRLVPLVTTNSPIMEYPERDIDEPLRRRVLELRFGVATTLPRHAADQLHDAYQRHHGAAGLIYLQHVVRRRDEIVRMLHSVDDYLASRGNSAESDRFTRWLMAAAAVGGRVAREAGVWKPDPAPIIEEILRRRDMQINEVMRDEERLSTALADYLSQNREHVVIWGMAYKGGGKDTMSDYPAVDVRRPIARYDRETGIVYIATGPARDWLKDQRVSMGAVDDWLVGHKIAKAKVRMAPSTPPVHAWAVDTRAAGLDMED